MRESRLSESDEAYLGPVAIAVLVEMGWINEWPWSVTAQGHRAIRSGYSRDKLPVASVCTGERDAEGVPLRKWRENPGGAYHWPGRNGSYIWEGRGA